MKSVLLVFFICPFLFAENAKLIRSCRVYDKVSKDATLACSLKSGDPVTLINKVDEKISEVSTLSCKGFLYSSCLSVIEEKEEISKTSKKHVVNKSAKLKVGFSIEGEGPIATVAGSTVLSRGLGYGFGALGQIRLIPGLYVLVLPSYRYQKLSRTLDGSGSLRDPNAGSFSQSVWNLSLGLSASVNIFELINGGVTNVPWTLRLGTEFLYPTSAKQTDSSGTELTFEASRMVNALLGTAIDFSISEKVYLRVGGDIFYHVTAKDSTSLYGVRAGVSALIDL